MPTEADFPELNDDFQNLDVTDNLPNPMPVKVDEDEHIFENYSFEHTYSPKLPITNFQNEVLDTIESNSVTVIQGNYKRIDFVTLQPVAMLLRTGLNNVVRPTMFKVFKNIKQHCYTQFSLNDIV